MSKKDKIWIILMKFGHVLGCHQKPERSFTVCDYQFPVCARCTGVLIGEWVMLLLVVIGIVPSVNIAIPTMMIMLFDWSLQALKILESTNVRRLITGFSGGIGMMNIYIVIIKALVHLLTS